MKTHYTDTHRNQVTVKILFHNYILLIKLNYIFTQNCKNWKQESLIIGFKLDWISQKLKIYLKYKDERRFY